MLTITNTQMGGGGHAVASLDLNAALAPYYAQLDETKEESGGIYVACQLASIQLKTSADALYRRLFDVRSLRAKSINAQTAEAITEAIADCRLEDLDIPTVPRSIKAALESVEAWAEELSSLEQMALARKLHRFACGYLLSFEDAEELVEAAKAQDAVAAEATEEELVAA